MVINKEIVSQVPSQSANYVAHPSDSKKTKIDSGIGQILLEAAEFNNTKLSKSVIIYNCLMQHSQISYRDGLTDIEDRLDEQLEEENIDVSEVNNVKNEYEDVDLYADEQKRMQVTLPKSVFDSVDFSRGWGRRIEEAVEHCVQSVYDNRKHRITVKQDILSVINNNMDVDDLDDVDTKVYKEVVETSIFDRFDDFWFDELENNKDKFVSKEEKMEALYEIYKRGDVGRIKLQNKFVEIFDYSNKYHAMSIFNNFCARYDVYEYNNFDELIFVDIDDFGYMLNNIKSHDNIDFVVYTLLNNYCEYLDENKSADGVIKILKDNQIVNDTSYETFAEYINKIQDEYGEIDNLRSTKHGTIRPVKD